MRADGTAYPRRLAFFTLPAPDDDADRPDHLRHSPDGLIDVVVEASDADVERGHDALDCYVTYQPVIEEHQPLRMVTNGITLELWGETYDPPLSDLLEALAEPSSLPDSPDGP
jgi:hypothetical protein